MTMFSESLRAFLKPVLPFLDDDDVTEVMINAPDEVWIERKGKIERVQAKFSPEGLLGTIRNIAQFVGRPLNEERPRLDARLPDGSRIHAVIEPITRRTALLNIRKFFKEKMGVEALLRRNSLSPPMARLLEVAIGCKLNIVVAGGTSSGKTTLLNIVASLIPPHDRILVLEDSSELQLNQPHVVCLEARPPDKSGKGAVDIGELLQSALRLRPDRIVVGEVRGPEAYYLVQAMNTGHGGSMATTHANTPTDTLRRVESLALMAAGEIPLVAMRAMVSGALELVVTCARLHDGSRRVTSIAEVLPLTEHGDFRTQELFSYTQVARGEDGTVIGYHGPTGLVPRFVSRAVANGFPDMTESFFDPATYGIPPPPAEIIAERVETVWAPSLKHRERHEKDPPKMAAQWKTFVEDLKAGRVSPAPAALPPEPTTSPGV